ncbi:unnamed protein product [Polarella glacialis]|uniref:Uncharacterized protein n=1 Tax=Polarella glacialis TaxID=89957 RepID=A0A813FXF0_POLGL|nr:unnamed protein product [Polarella glacialis]
MPPPSSLPHREGYEQEQESEQQQQQQQEHRLEMPDPALAGDGTALVLHEHPAPLVVSPRAPTRAAHSSSWGRGARGSWRSTGRGAAAALRAAVQGTSFCQQQQHHHYGDDIELFCSQEPSTQGCIMDRQDNSPEERGELQQQVASAHPQPTVTVAEKAPLTGAVIDVPDGDGTSPTAQLPPSKRRRASSQGRGSPAVMEERQPLMEGSEQIVTCLADRLEHVAEGQEQRRPSRSTCLVQCQEQEVHCLSVFQITVCRDLRVVLSLFAVICDLNHVIWAY